MTLTPDQERQQVITVGMALKLAHMTRFQATECAYRDAELQIRANDAERQRTEDIRSQRRNRNRCYMLLAGFILALVWPVATLSVIHWTAGLRWTPAISVVGDLAVTTYAYFRKY